MGWLAARTDPGAPKHRGLSTFALPMDTPGVEIRPIENLAGERQLAEVQLHDVRIPIEQRVGPEHRGWYHVASTLDFERSGVAAFARGRRHIEGLVRFAQEHTNEEERREQVRYELADRWIELEVGFNVAQRVPWMQTQGISPNHEASVSKVYGSELTQRIAGTGVRLFGLAGLIAPGGADAPAGGAFARHYLTATGATIEAGTSEIQRNIIAQRGLGSSAVGEPARAAAVTHLPPRVRPSLGIAESRTPVPIRIIQCRRGSLATARISVEPQVVTDVGASKRWYSMSDRALIDERSAFRPRHFGGGNRETEPRRSSQLRNGWESVRQAPSGVATHRSSRMSEDCIAEHGVPASVAHLCRSELPPRPSHHLIESTLSAGLGARFKVRVLLA